MANAYQEQAKDHISVLRNAHEYGFEAPARTWVEMHLARIECKRFRRMAWTRQIIKEIAEEAGIRVLYEI